MNLYKINHLSKEELSKELYKCCGSTTWVNNMLKYFPVEELVDLLEYSEIEWWNCSEADWKEAFAQHPKIGDLESIKKKFTTTADWASSEQGQVQQAGEETLKAIASGNKKYEEKFGYIFIVCATGKSADEILTILNTRLQNSPEVEIDVAADEQLQILQLRLEKLLEVDLK
jgi:2-oxo-4-hydroxy-4-carboxy-5-ureidoimidazoline decarboxylase